MKLRPHQIECLNAIREAFKSKKRILVKAPCSFGKTIVFCEIAKMVFQKGNTCLIVVDNVALVKQTYDKLLNFLPIDVVGIYCSSLGRFDLSSVVVSTIQSVSKSNHKYGLIVVDECHDGIDRVRKFCDKQDTFVVGFTATPYNAKGEAIYGQEEFYQDKVYEISAHEMIGRGYITPMLYGAERDETKIDLSKVELVKGDYKESSLIKAYEMQTEKIELQIKDMLSRIGDRKKVIIITTGIKHANYIASILKDSVTYHSDIDVLERKNILERFQAGKEKFLIGVMAIYKGLDVPDVDCLVNMRPTKSKSLFVQFAGRGVRKAEGKENCLFLDYGQTVMELGFYEDIKEHPKKAKNYTIAPVTYPKKCPACFSLVSPQTRYCDCGHQFPFDSIQNTVEEAFKSWDVKSGLIRSKFMDYEIINEGVKSKISIRLHDPNEIPHHAKGSRFRLYFYFNLVQDWQRWKFNSVCGKLKRGDIIVWELNKQGWPTFIDCVKEESHAGAGATESKDNGAGIKNF